MGRKGVDRLHSHPVQADGKLEDIVIVLGACVDLADALDHLAERNPPSLIPHRNRRGLLIELDLDLFCHAHDELID